MHMRQLPLFDHCFEPFIDRQSVNLQNINDVIWQMNRHYAPQALA